MLEKNAERFERLSIGKNIWTGLKQDFDHCSATMTATSIRSLSKSQDFNLYLYATYVNKASGL